MRVSTWLKHKLNSPDLPYLGVLFAIFSVIVITNFPASGQFLSGWDNLHPEFNFSLNFRRAFEGVWQSNEGLGLVGGHGYAATLPHTVFLWLLSFIFPTNALRAIFTFLMLLVGSLGTYFLTRYLLKHISHNQSPTTNNIQLASLFSALFAMLNIGTVQNFYIQLEAFIVHFAFLPWLMLTLWKYLKHPTKKRLLWFIGINIAILPAGFIPPLFVVQILLITLSLIVWINHNITKEKLKRARAVILIIICINAYWLLPFAYYTVTHSQYYLNAYNNLQSTQDFISKNQKYGDISDVALIKSFLFDANDVTKDGSLVKILAPWVEHFNNPVVRTIGYAVFILSVIGTGYLLTRKHNRKNNIAIVAGYVLIFLLLATGTPPFSWVTQWLRAHSPLFEQAFRVAFTKFSVAYGLHLTVLAGIGLYAVILKIKHYIIRIIIPVSVLGMLMFYAWPAFNSNFLYKTTKISIPKEYFELFDYMKAQEPQGRIMNLPQGWNWGWTLYKWGYSGSGFLWYGIEQPVMDRAFDVWSPYNENYYWELVHALYAKDWKQFEGIVEKYHTQWILYDPSVIPVPGGKWIFYTQDLEDYLGSNPKYTLEKQFGGLKLFSIRLENNPQENILVYNQIPNVLPAYKWNSYDSAINTSLGYKSNKDLPAAYYYPYRSLFTNRKVNEREINITKGQNGYNLSPVFETSGPESRVKTAQLDNFIPVKIRLQDVSEKQLVLEYSYIYPNTRGSFVPTKANSRTVKIPQKQNTITVSVFGERLPLISDGQSIFKDTIALYWWDSDAQIVIYGDNNAVIDVFSLPKPELASSNSTSDEVYVPFVAGSLSYDSENNANFLSHKISDCKNVQENDQPIIWDEGNKVLKFVSSSKDQCFDIVLPYLRQDTAYIVEVESKIISGKPLQFAFINKQVEKTDFELPLSTLPGYQTAYFIIPPMQFDGLGYSLNFTNKATGAGLSENLLKSVRVTPIPYTYLSTLRYEYGSKQPQQNDNFSSKMIASYLYKATVQNNTSENKDIVLSQSFDKGWKAYNIKNQSFDSPPVGEFAQDKISKIKNFLSLTFPFWFGEELKNHILVNNWANGWRLPSPVVSSKLSVVSEENQPINIVIFFLPQVLEWIGFALMPIPFLVAWKSKQYKTK